MPRKNSLKTYVDGGYYHIYNRGVEKRNIFLDDRDYKVFLYFFKKYLSPSLSPSVFLTETAVTGVTPVRIRPIQSLYNLVDLLTYCLMPNHFHLIVKQNIRDGITKLMNRIGTSYGMYFNKRYDRVGPLFQGVYKAVLIEKEEYLLHLSRYIHLNPLEIDKMTLKKLVDYSYSSYGDYLGERKTIWLKTEEILSFFKTKKRIGEIDYFSYQSFVENYKVDYDLTDISLEV